MGISGKTNFIAVEIQSLDVLMKYHERILALVSNIDQNRSFADNLYFYSCAELAIACDFYRLLDYRLVWSLRLHSGSFLFAGITDWDDFGILSQVLATSQEEYLDSLRRQKDKDNKTEDICET